MARCWWALPLIAVRKETTTWKSFISTAAAIVAVAIAFAVTPAFAKGHASHKPPVIVKKG